MNNEKIIKLPKQVEEMKTQLESKANDYIHLSKFGTYGNGNAIEDTTTIQKAVDWCCNNLKNLEIPNKNFKIIPSKGTDEGNPTLGKGVFITKPIKIFIREGATFKCEPSDLNNVTMFMIRNCSNVEINGGEFIGDRNEHLVSTGEGGGALTGSCCHNILIKNVKIRDCWGDGACFSSYPAYLGSYDLSNIKFENVKITNCGRNNLTLGSVKYFSASNCEFSSANRVLPMAGVDIEPDHGTGAYDINFKNCIFSNNVGLDIAYGGGIGCDNVNVDNCIFSSIGSGSIVAKATGGKATITNNTINLKKNYAFIIDADNVKIDNNKITGIFDTGISCSFMNINSNISGLKITNNIIYNVDYVIQPIGESSLSKSNIENNTISNCGRGTYINLNDVKIKSNTFENFKGNAIRGITNKIIIKENTFINFTNGILEFSNMSESNISNNIFKTWGTVQNQPCLLIFTGSDLLIDTNNFLGINTNKLLELQIDAKSVFSNNKATFLTSGGIIVPSTTIVYNTFYAK